MDNESLEVTKAINELLSSRQKRFLDQQQQMAEVQGKVDRLEKLCTNLTNDNIKLREDLTTSKNQEEETKLILSRHEEQFKELDGWRNVLTTVAGQLNDLKSQTVAFDSRITELEERITNHHRHLQNIINNQRKQPPTPTYTQRQNHMRRSMSSRFSNIDHSSPLHESLDDEAISLLSDQTEHLKRGVEALNELQRSFEKNSLYYDD